jgi:hypothetical protein
MLARVDGTVPLLPLPRGAQTATHLTKFVHSVGAFRFVRGASTKETASAWAQSPFQSRNAAAKAAVQTSMPFSSHIRARHRR